MLRYIFHNKKKSLTKIINDDVDIYRKLNLYDQKKNEFRREKKKVWKELVKKIKKNLKFREKKFIKESLYSLSPFFENNYFKEFDLKPKFGPFDYKVTKKTIDLHVPLIGLYPKNLKNKEIRNELTLKSLYLLILYAQKKKPSLNMIQMGSWINENKNFRNLFPKSWKKSKKISKNNNLATWGQFVKHDGRINLNLKNKFIKNYNFPIKPYVYKCSINDLKTHLKTKINF